MMLYFLIKDYCQSSRLLKNCSFREIFFLQIASYKYLEIDVIKNALIQRT